ncbi:MAG: hypothetical protein ACI88A_001911 [Paraglaciecola sp.]|jgi:hypothetical protein
MTLRILQKAFVILTTMMFCTQAYAQTVTPVSVTVDGNKLQAKLSVTQTIEIDLLLEFENSIGLSTSSIDISATLVDINDASVLSRLSSTDIAVIPSFPVIVSVTPKSDAGFSFEGLASIEIYTKAVDYNASMPARIFRSHANGAFEDITSMVSVGSIRSRGNTGSFSDFMILLDERDDDDMIADKFTQLAQVLSQHSALSSVALATSLQTKLDAINNALVLINYSATLVAVENMIGLVESANSANISTVWRSSNDLVNLQGELLTHLKALKYTLRVM